MIGIKFFGDCYQTDSSDEDEEDQAARTDETGLSYLSKACNLDVEEEEGVDDDDDEVVIIDKPIEHDLCCISAMFLTESSLDTCLLNDRFMKMEVGELNKERLCDDLKFLVLYQEIV